jgi:hypothetical protein
MVAALDRESLQGTRREAHIFILDSTLLFFFRFPVHRSCHGMSWGMQGVCAITLPCTVRQKINPIGVVDWTRIRSGHFSLWYALGKSLLDMVAWRKPWNLTETWGRCPGYERLLKDVSEFLLTVFFSFHSLNSGHRPWCAVEFMFRQDCNRQGGTDEHEP